MSLGLYDRRPCLPHPPISIATFLIVEQAVRAAWDLLRKRPSNGFDLRQAYEDTVTQELYEALYDEVFASGIVPGFDRDLFTVVTRESKVRNYDGAHLDKMPDLLIGLKGRDNVYRPSQDWLFIECKPVDPTHTAGVHYGKKGLIRFVRGDYAWTMSSALMIGYARDGYTISSRLRVALERHVSQLPTTSLPTVCDHSCETSVAEPVQISIHGRLFRYRETGDQAPEITIRHLWLRRD